MSDSPKKPAQRPVTPAEFTKGMPEGEGAGPEAPETTESTAQPEGTAPGGPAMKGLGKKKA
jgi:hypothetical protein